MVSSGIVAEPDVPLFSTLLIFQAAAWALPSLSVPHCIWLDLYCVLYKGYCKVGFPANSVGKKSVCNAGDPGSIPGSGRFAGEGIGYPLQCSWASLVAQIVKNLPAMQRPEFDPWIGKILWRREQLPTPVF